MGARLREMGEDNHRYHGNRYAKEHPGIPHREPQRPRDRRITRGLKFSELPSKRGSRKLPIII